MHYSMIFRLPYWSSLSMWHCIDLMHTEKNVLDNILYSIVSDLKKIKDHSKAWANCMLMDVLPHLWILDGPKKKKPKAPFTLTPKQRKLMCDWFRSLALPNSYASNIICCCKDNCNFSRFKSHDCHIIMQKFLSHAIHELLPNTL